MHRQLRPTVWRGVRQHRKPQGWIPTACSGAPAGHGVIPHRALTSGRATGPAGGAASDGCVGQWHALRRSPGGCRPAPCLALALRRSSGGAGGSAAEEQKEEAPSPEPWYVQYRWALAAAAAVPVVGGLTYGILYSPMFGAIPEMTFDIKPISEEVFDKSDNLFVFFLDSGEEKTERLSDLHRVIKTLSGEKSLRRLSYYYNVRKEGDPPLPDEAGAPADKAPGRPPMRCVMYKGQRKEVLKVDAEVPVQEVLNFFNLLSEEITEPLRKLEVPRVSSLSFAQDVIEASSPSKPILLQMYEDTCFLCFLMRPFVNTLARVFKENGVPLVIKRLNIEKNDFPDGCPVARGTPTFALFNGKGEAPVKWDEFKPRELVEKLAKTFPSHTDPLFDQLDELQGMVNRRFNLFTQLVMWTLELQKLEKLIATASPSAAEGQAAAGGEAKEREDAEFNAMISELMAKDMKRTDGIYENLAHLQKEVDEVEHDAALMGTMLAESILRREKAEEAG